MKLDIVVPVSPLEPLSVIKKSVESLSRLEHGDMDIRMTYIIDTFRKDDPRVVYLQSQSVYTIVRNHGHGRRAGAINDALDEMGKTDYLALFDVDSRPDPNFLVECVRRIQETGAVIASAQRYVTNLDASITTRIVDAEYALLMDVYQFLDHCDGFKQFNGLIGVLDARIFNDRRFDESAACEDVDITQQIYLEGKIAALVDTTLVGEQAPISIHDYYHQRVRWLTGAYEGLKNLSKFKRAKIPRSRKITWFSAMTVPFFISLFSPLALLYSIRLWRLSHSRKDFVIKSFGLIAHAWILQMCGLTVLLRRLFDMGVTWKDMHRSNV